MHIAMLVDNKKESMRQFSSAFTVISGKQNVG